LLDWDGLGAFWSSELGARIRTEAGFVQRELPFTARFSPQELAGITGEPVDPSLASEFVVVQGVVDLAVIRPQEIWVLDFKTDDVAPKELSDKVKRYEPQLRLYAQALQRIYKRPAVGVWLYFLEAREQINLA
jgi:ATP-dependent helicase/nuclease subunit A